MGRKTNIILLVIVTIIIIAIVTIVPERNGVNTSLEEINWPDFIKVNNEYYIFSGDYEVKEHMGNLIGEVRKNTPKKTSKYIAQNFESSILSKGTKIYEVIGGKDIVASTKEGYKVYTVISAQEFSDLLD